MRQNVLTKEASVCAWLGIDHMALTRVGFGANDRRWRWLHPTSHVSAWGLLLLAADSGLPHWASTRGQFTKCHKHLRHWGIMCVGMLSISPSIHPSSLINPQQDAMWSEVLVTLWVWVQPSVPRIHPYRAFFVLVCHTAAMVICKGCNISVYLCLSVCLGGGGQFRLTWRAAQVFIRLFSFESEVIKW